MSAPPIDFKAYQRNATVVELVPVSDRARAYLAERRTSSFSRGGLRDLIRAGWVVVAGSSS